MDKLLLEYIINFGSKESTVEVQLAELKILIDAVCNKPSWDTAPDWANWLSCGRWFWYSGEPGYSEDRVWRVEGVYGSSLKASIKGAETTLQQRPGVSGIPKFSLRRKREGVKHEYPIRSFQLYLTGLYVILDNGVQLVLDRDKKIPCVYADGVKLNLQTFIKTYCQGGRHEQPRT